MISNRAKNLSSPAHIRYSSRIGEDAQRKFYQSCKAAGLNIKKTSKENDIAHIDFVVDSKTVDVKGMKETHKKGQILVELKNVRGNDGWCSASGPEWIAFDFGVFFVMVRNKDLNALVVASCDLTKKVNKASEALYKAYTRKDRLDLMTVVSLTDVIRNCEHWYLPAQDHYEPMDLL